MTSNLFSRLASASQTRSFYQELRARDDDFDVEDRAGFALDEENLNHRFQDDDIDTGNLALNQMRTVLASDPCPPERQRRHGHGHDAPPHWGPDNDDWDNDVPGSLLFEQNAPYATTTVHDRQRRCIAPQRSHADLMHQTRGNRVLGDATKHQHRLYHHDTLPSNEPSHSHIGPSHRVASMVAGTSKQKAMWRWINVTNLDSFMHDVYDYYQGNGLGCILLDRVLHLVEVGFIAVFLTFLTQCVNYHEIPNNKTMHQIVVPSCTKKLSGPWNFGLWIFVFYVIWKALQIPLDLRRLLNLRDFYVCLLEIAEADMQTVSWQDVVAQIMRLREQNPKTANHLTPRQRKWLGSHSKERLDAHDIANRLMRRENFLIALINKDILDLTIPLPFLSGRQFLSRLLEWTLIFSILDFVFDQRGQVNQEFLKSDRRGQLSQKLRARFLFAGAMTLMIAPFMAGYLFITHFLTYFHEYHKNPSALGTRAYTPLAEWKFREFNELPHIFQERLNMSYPFATRYLDQFPKEMTARLARTVAFIAGALATVLAIATMVDPELFLSFEITHDRTVLFYLSIFAGAWAFARGMVPGENTVFEPEYALRQVIEYTHHKPDHWEAAGLHSHAVKNEFSALYKNKLVIFLEDIVGILIAPLILSISLPRSSDQIVDFFREFTIHVDGLGYICAFAEFDFKKGVRKPQRDSDARDEYYSTKHGKTAASFYGFLDNYVINPRTGIPGHLPSGARPHFQPPPAFPGLQSPTWAADMGTSQAGRSELGQTRSRGPGGGPSNSSRAVKSRPAPPVLSPMASILLDPRHQPQVLSIGRSVHGARQGGQGGEDAIEEGSEGGNEDTENTRYEDDEAHENGYGLGESAWQAFPAQAPFRDHSATNEGEEDVGVLGMVYQFQRDMKKMPSGVR